MRRARARYAKAAEWVPSLKVWATPITSSARFAEAHWYCNQGIDPPDAPISSVRIKTCGAGRVVGLRYIPDSN